MIKTGIKIALSLSFFLSMGMNVVSQTPPANTYQEGFWQPIARVDNPQFPMTVELVNQTGLNLDYGLTTDSPIQVPEYLRPGATTSIVLADPEANISIGYIPLDPRNEEISFEYNITINSNSSIRFEILRTDKPDRVGDGIGRVIDIQSTGGIFIY
ncbi:hypothetical protein PN466_18400 [Roseofilum reptotaenium CS-1145]|uniref:Uncharacterized protein n=1 Tax=Roseofilum reptotaenium AO1-A TaxID=1925591 RepID=A0A1L9QSL2_9CYAN|nr:hypothetical protein [Roseofilum reptotaenium]MDB9518918.1 hypothetical protein [Roseofilum reptotaenium CS-1145]OJJ25654.1 hypothetical protein BI308_10025 [Roseofilum reptotaenium AO1-A]